MFNLRSPSHSEDEYMKSMLQWAEDVNKKALENIKKAQKKQKKFMTPDTRNPHFKSERWYGDIIPGNKHDKEENLNTIGMDHMKLWSKIPGDHTS